MRTENNRRAPLPSDRRVRTSMNDLGYLVLAVLLVGPLAAHADVDLTGLWRLQSSFQHEIKTTEGRTPPLLPAAAETYRKNLAKSAAGDFSFDKSQTLCTSPGMPRLVMLPYPFEIVQEPHRLAFVFQWNHRFRLVDLGGSLAPGLPQACFGHQLADRLLAEGHAVHFTQLLPGQRRAEIRVALLDQSKRTAGQALIEAVVAGPSVPGRDQRRGSAGLVSLDQSLDLPAADPESFGSLADPQHPIDDALDGLEAIELAHAHRDARCNPRHPRPQ